MKWFKSFRGKMGVALPDVAGTWVKSKRGFLSKLQTYTVQYSSHYAMWLLSLKCGPLSCLVNSLRAFKFPLMSL